MKKIISLVLVLCLCLSMGVTALASGEASGEAAGDELVLLNGKDNKSEAYGMDTWYAEVLTAEALSSLTESSIVVYTNDADGITDELSASVHGEYTTTVGDITVYLVPMDEVIILSAGEYEQDYIAQDGENVLIVLEDGASLTGTLTNVSLSMQDEATWTLTGESVLIGLDACRPTVRSNVYGSGNIGWYNSEVYLSDDMREWTEQVADTISSLTSYSDATALSFDDYRDAILAGEKASVISHDNFLMSIFPVNMAALINASVYDNEIDEADVSEESGVYTWTDEYAGLRNGHGYSGGDIEYTTVITTDPSANGQVNRSSIYATDSTVSYDGLLIQQLSYATSVVYADGTNRGQDAMMKYGVNSAVWAQGEDAVIDLQNFYILGANDGAYATYGGTVILQNGVLDVTANHGLQICYDGTIIARNMDIITTGMMGSAISSDHGGGFLLADNVFALAAYGSTGGSGIYCDGYCDFWIMNSTVGSLNDNGAVMCGGGTLNLINTTVFSQYDSSTIEASFSASGESSGEASGETEEDGEETVIYGAGVYVHPMGNNPGQVTTLNMTDVVLDAPGYGIWTFGKSTNITISGTLDVSAVGSGILLYAKQMDGGNDFMGGLTLDMAYEIPENVTNIVFDGGVLIGTGDIVKAAEDDESGNYAEINVTLQNGSSYAGAVNADTMTIDETSTWTVTGESIIGDLDCQGTLEGEATQLEDGTWLVTPLA
ncbi:MAG: hypothetical protein LUH42_03085 [Oscillospiraceae bacterium]|nr:hypothetical protein [Oscillospiraceae bacterium]